MSEMPNRITSYITNEAVNAYVIVIPPKALKKIIISNIPIMAFES
jgi:hypothetical protein